MTVAIMIAGPCCLAGSQPMAACSSARVSFARSRSQHSIPRVQRSDDQYAAEGHREQSSESAASHSG